MSQEGTKSGLVGCGAFVSGIMSFVLTIFLVSQAWLTAPLFCSKPYTDPFVVTTTVGRYTSITMYCVGARGQRHDVGILLPSLVVWLADFLLISSIISLLLFVAWSISRVRPS
jgi:hypothetical protein